jgi:hypothetical protein
MSSEQTSIQSILRYALTVLSQSSAYLVLMRLLEALFYRDVQVADAF